MTEFKSAFIDTSPFIYYIEKSELYFEKMKSWFSKCYDLEKQLVTSPVTVEEYCVFHLKNLRFEYDCGRISGSASSSQKLCIPLS